VPSQPAKKALTPFMLDSILHRIDSLMEKPMRPELLFVFPLLCAQSSVFAQQLATRQAGDELGSNILVCLSIVAVYAWYWLKQKA